MPRLGGESLAGVRPDGNGGFVVDRPRPSQRDAGRGRIVDLADAGGPVQCRFHRDPILPGGRVDRSPLGSKRWLQQVQSTDVGQAVFRNRSNQISFYKEMSYGECNPKSYGSAFRLSPPAVAARSFAIGASPKVKVKVRVDAGAFRAATAEQPVRFDVDMGVTFPSTKAYLSVMGGMPYSGVQGAQMVAPRGNMLAAYRNARSWRMAASALERTAAAVSLAARLVGPSIVAPSVVAGPVVTSSTCVRPLIVNDTGDATATAAMPAAAEPRATLPRAAAAAAAAAANGRRLTAQQHLRGMESALDNRRMISSRQVSAAFAQRSAAAAKQRGLYPKLKRVRRISDDQSNDQNEDLPLPAAATSAAANTSAASRRRAPLDPCNATIRIGFEVNVRDPGAYLLEVLLSHALGVDLNHLAHRSALAVAPAPHAARRRVGPAVPQQCEAGGAHPGRWVRPAALAGCGRGAATGTSGGAGDTTGGATSTPSPPPPLPPYCSAINATLDLVEDEARYNRGYVWQPHGCYYQPYDARAISECANRCGYGAIGFTGDSLGREAFANLLQIIGDARGDTPVIDGRAVNTGSENILTVRLPAPSKARRKERGRLLKMFWNHGLPGPGKVTQPDVFVSTPVAATAIAHGASPACVRQQIETDLVDLKRACDEGGVLCVVQVPPALQRSHYIDAFSPKQKPEIELTRGVMRGLAEHTLKVATRLELPVLDAFATTDARWFASWDGLHYTFSARTTNDASTSARHWKWQWQGGVSYTNTLILLNMLCNRCAGANATARKREKLASARKPGEIVEPFVPMLFGTRDGSCARRFRETPDIVAALAREKRQILAEQADKSGGAGKRGGVGKLDRAVTRAQLDAIEDKLLKQDAKIEEMHQLLKENNLLLTRLLRVERGERGMERGSGLPLRNYSTGAHRAREVARSERAALHEQTHGASAARRAAGIRQSRRGTPKGRF